MPSLWADLLVGLGIARGSVRDRFRRHTSSRREKALFALLAVLVLPGVILFTQQAYSAGVLTRDGVDAPIVAVARNLLVPSMLVLTVVGGLEAIQQLGSDTIRPLVLTTAPTRAIVIGKVISLLVSWLTLLALGYLLVLAYAVGARAPLFPVAVFLAALPVFLLVLLVGLALGYLLWLAVERLGLSEGARQLLTAALYLGIVALIFAGGSLLGGASASGGLSGLVPTDNPTIPLGWYADLFFLGSPMATSIGTKSLLATAVLLGAVPLSFALVVRLAPLYWYATPAVSEMSEKTDGTPDLPQQPPSAMIGRTAGTFAGRSPTVRVALSVIRSARRKPSQFVYLFYYLFPVAPILAQQAIGRPGTFPLTVGASFVLLGVWFAGGIFCLNPLGNEGPMLSQIVLAERPAETFVHARLAVGGTIGVALTTAGMLIVALSNSQVTPLVAGAGIVFAGIAAITSAGLALGLGSVLPKFEAVEVFESVETVAPSIVAAVVHAVISVLILVGALGVALAVGVPESPLSTPQQLTAVGGFLLTAGIITDGSRRYATARLRDYGRDIARTDRSFAVYASIGLAFVAFLLGQAISTVAILLLGIDGPAELLFPLLFVVQYLGFAMVGLGFLYATRRGLSYVDLSRPSWRDVAFVAGGVIVSFGIWTAMSVTITGLELPAADHALFDAEDDGTAGLLLLLIPLVLLVNGPVEEFLYRNVIQKYLTERFSTRIAILLASAIFALSHVPAYITAGFGALLVTLGVLFVLACFWGLIYSHTESLTVVSAVHGLYNATLVFVLYLQIS